MAKKKQDLVKEEPTEKDIVIRNITNLCTTIGDKEFLIRRTKLEIQSLFCEIDAARAKLQGLEANGSQSTK